MLCFTHKNVDEHESVLNSLKSSTFAKIMILSVRCTIKIKKNMRMVENRSIKSLPARDQTNSLIPSHCI
jgi:hypothetical protein